MFVILYARIQIFSTLYGASYLFRSVITNLYQYLFLTSLWKKRYIQNNTIKCMNWAALTNWPKWSLKNGCLVWIIEAKIQQFKLCFFVIYKTVFLHMIYITRFSEKKFFFHIYTIFFLRKKMLLPNIWNWIPFIFF